MDKQSFLGYIKTLGLKPKMEKSLLDYVESREFNDETVENVAKILEDAADMAGMASEELDKVVVEMEGLKDELLDEADNYEEMGDQAEEKYMNDMSAVMDEEIPTQPAASVESPASPLEVVTPPEELTPPAPVVPLPEPTPLQPVQQQNDLSSFSPVPQSSEVPQVTQPLTPQPVQPTEQTTEQPVDISPVTPAPQPPTF